MAVPPDRVGKDESAVREFGPHTEDLAAIADWLSCCRIDTDTLALCGIRLAIRVQLTGKCQWRSKPAIRWRSGFSGHACCPCEM